MVLIMDIPCKGIKRYSLEMYYLTSELKFKFLCLQMLSQIENEYGRKAQEETSLSIPQSCAGNIFCVQLSPRQEMWQPETMLPANKEWDAQNRKLTQVPKPFIWDWDISF